MFAAKFVLAIAIVSITTYLGYSCASKLKKREETLNECVTFFEFVENEIKYTMSVLPNAYEAARQKLNGNLKLAIGQIVVDMLQNDNFDMVTQSIVENINKIKELAPYDKNIIISTLKNIGRSDLDSQINILENSKRVLLKQIDEAREYKNKNSKLYKTVGTIVGIMVVIVLV